MIRNRLKAGAFAVCCLVMMAGCKQEQADQPVQSTAAETVTQSTAEQPTIAAQPETETAPQTEELIEVQVIPGALSTGQPSIGINVLSGSETANGFEQRSEVVYATEKVNIRAETSTDAAKIGSLEAGQSANRIGYTAEWSQINLNGTICYVASAYLTTTQPQAVNPQVQASSGELWSGDITTLKTNVFSGMAAYDDRDAKNVPNGCYYLEKLYSKFNATFLEDTTQNIIYLTMDEGYEAGFTPQILDTLKEKNVTATFFVTKEFYDSNPEYIARMIQDGHTVGNHTCNHKNMPTLTLEQQTNEIMVLHNIIREQFGYEMKLFRFPEGSTSEQALALVESLGYKSVFWSFHYLDYQEVQKDPAETLKLCMDSIHPGAIYLLHAKSSTNTMILGQWIDAVRAAGYEFGGGIPIS